MSIMDLRNASHLYIGQDYSGEVYGTEVSKLYYGATEIWTKIANNWRPTDLEGDLVAWFDAHDSDSIEVDGDGRIQVWSDKSGNDYHMDQSYSGYARPIYDTSGETPLVHRGPSEYLGADHRFGLPADPSPFLVFAVVDAEPSNEDIRIVQIGEGAGSLGMCVRDGNGLSWRFGDGYSLHEGLPDIRGEKAIAVWNRSLPYYFSSGARLNGESGSSTSNDNAVGIPNDTTPIASIGSAKPGGTPQGGNVRVHEVVIATATNYPENRDPLAGYLAHKHGLADKLPSNHPYKSSPP